LDNILYTVGNTYVITSVSFVAHSPPSSAEVKNAWSYTFTPPVRLHGVVLS